VKYALLILLGLAWSGRLTAIKFAAESGASIPQILTLSATGIFGAFVVVCLLRGGWPSFRRSVVMFAGATAVLGFLAPFGLEITVAPHLPVFLLVVLIATMPLVTYGLSTALGIERLHRTRLFAVIGGLGSVILIAADSHARPEGSVTHPIWIIAALAIPVLYAVNTIFLSRRWPPGEDAVGIALIQSAIVAPILLAVFFQQAVGALQTLSSETYAALFLIVLAEATALLIFLALARDYGAVFVAQGNYLSILFGAAFGALFFGDDLGLGSVIGGFGVATALFFLNRRPPTVAR